MKNPFSHICISIFGLTFVAATMLTSGTALALDANSFLGVWHSGPVHAHVHHRDGAHVGETYGDLEFKEVHDG